MRGRGGGDGGSGGGWAVRVPRAGPRRAAHPGRSSAAGLGGAGEERVAFRLANGAPAVQSANVAAAGAGVKREREGAGAGCKVGGIEKLNPKF